ncbi:MAG: nucleotide exchange factor GrpE [Parvibaculum sp.]|uniref:nucleotide exchange factor GrpE n=1 Tax=Parvibaculum sp. TaxID=2024848 RepID=UPI00275B5D56|nr:nucleotide exchange factor GrpE [Parvibaculum sp.]MDP2125555.1 nucleotide exchange factor GrpE [Parvibaculum sp.]MDZ4380838.1 nucleotide exchange factor GrpE [Parvibaculum sp.]
MSDENSKPDTGTPETAAKLAESLAAEPARQGEAADAAAPDAAETGADVAALETEIAELKDRLLRVAAEMENTRKRAERDKADATRYAAANFARDMLQVADNLRRAIGTLKDDEREGADESVKAMVEGVEMTERQLLSIFERHGIREITPQAGERFDPNLHEAMFEVPGSGHPAGTVVHVLEGGYMIGERLLRAARVGVAKAEGAEKGASVDTTA